MKRWLAPLALCAALTPALVVGYQALSLSEGHAQARPKTARDRLLERIPSDPAVLINVKRPDMPASPDILELGKRSTKALERCLSDNVDADNRSLCAVVLEALGDRSALSTLQVALEDWDVNVRYRVAKALAVVPDKSSVTPLIELFDRKDEAVHVRAAVLRALGNISDARVVRKLRDVVRSEPKDGAPDLRPQAFDALWQNRHLMARATLVADTRAALKSDNDALVLSATLASAELRSPRLVEALIPLMEHPGEEVRNKAVYALGRIGDRTATKALLARLPEVRESRMLNNIAFALERLDKKAFYESIAGVVAHKQAVIRLNAAFVLGDVRHPEGLPLLEKALADPSDYVRTSAIFAVGNLALTDEAELKRALAALEPFARDPNLVVRQEAIYSLHWLTQGGRSDLVYRELFQKLDRQRHADAVRRAALVLGEAGDRRVRDYLVSCLVHDACSVGQVGDYLRAHGDASARGRLLLAWARRNIELSGLVAELAPAGTLPIARSALEDDWTWPQSAMTTASLRVLGSLREPKIKPLLERRAGTRHAWARIYSQVALARLGDEKAGARLPVELDNLAAEWMPHYVQALATIEEPKVRQKIAPELDRRAASSDPHVSAAAAAVLLSWQPEQAIFRFREVLAADDGFARELAERYLVDDPQRKVTWLLRRVLAREGKQDTADRLRSILEARR